MAKPIEYYDRASRSMKQEVILGDTLLRLAYSTPGRLLGGWLLFGSALCSRILGWYADRPSSKRKIPETIRQLGIKMEDYAIPDGGFQNFNSFFFRHLRPGARNLHQGRLVAPADCRMTVWPRLKQNTCIPVKGLSFGVRELLGQEGEKYADRFQNGSLCVARLCPADYHRYHFPATGKVLAHWRIEGKYHSVSPVALTKGIPIFPHNVREISILDLGRELGTCAYIEVGAFGVGSIVQTHPDVNFQQGEEKGYFAFGGSTIILIFEPGKVHFSHDLLQYSAEGTEVRLQAGDSLE